jgi:polysaccharide biosynthesis/export protein
MAPTRDRSDVIIQRMSFVLAALRALLSSRRASTGLKASLIGFLALAAGCSSTRGGPIPYDVQNFGVPDAPRATTPDAEYRIATGDTLQMTVFNVEALSREYRVDLAGNVAIPLIGEVPAVGRTTSELKTDVARRLGERYLRNPDVTIAVTNSTNNRITVEGGVRGAGLFPVTGPMTLIQAVALAGGIDPQNGNARRVAIFRQVQGQRMAAAFDLASIRAGEMPDPQVYPGDIVVVQSNSRRGLLQDLLTTLPIFAVFRPF